jgi:import inner membrane translocase subunit TIM13
MTAKKEAVMNGVRSEIALASAQELINKTNEKCFAKCITAEIDSSIKYPIHPYL